MTSTILDFDLLAIVALLPIAAMMVVTQRNPYHALVVRGILGAISALVYALLGAADVALTEALVGTMLAVTLYMVAVRSSLVLQFGVLAESSDIAESVASPQSPLTPTHPATDATGTSELAELLGLPPLSPSPDAPDASQSPTPRLTSTPDLTPESTPASTPESMALDALLTDLRLFCRQHFLRLDLKTYGDREALYTALENQEVHAIGLQSASSAVTAPSAAIAQASDPVPTTYTVTVRVPRLYDLMQTELNPAIVTLQPTFPVEVPAHKASTPNPSTP